MGYIALLVTGLLYSCVTGDLEPKSLETQEPQIQSQEPQIAEAEEPDGSVLRASFAGGRATKTDFGRFTTSESYAEIYWSENDSIIVFLVIAAVYFFVKDQLTYPKMKEEIQHMELQKENSISKR